MASSPGDAIFRIDADLCSGCGSCEAVCPTGAARVQKGIAQIDTLLCARCGACLADCPTGAVIQDRITSED